MTDNSLNARYLTGSEAAQIHKSIIEFYFVRERTATPVTGGARLSNKAIRGGGARVIKPGEVIFILPGVPHAIRDTTGIAYLNVHFGGIDWILVTESVRPDTRYAWHSPGSRSRCAGGSGIG
jgi:mannose-6-phosphate isomerase-like protein (cupin superfamily)